MRNEFGIRKVGDIGVSGYGKNEMSPCNEVGKVTGKCESKREKH